MCVCMFFHLCGCMCACVGMHVEPEAVSEDVLICSLSLFLEVGSRSTPGLADIAIWTANLLWGPLALTFRG